MFKRITICIFVLVTFCAVDAIAETPQEGASKILEYLEGKNYSDIFQHRYTEWYKAEAAGMKTKTAIDKLSTRWEKNHGVMVNLYKQLSKAEFKFSKNQNPQKTETGDVATAKVTIGGKEVPYRLYKMKNGLWGFHM